jgi:hypothetical protein
MSEQQPDKPQPKSRRSAVAKPGLPFGRGLFGWVLLVALLILVIIFLSEKKGTFTQVQLTDVLPRLEKDKVETMTIGADDLSGKFRDVQDITVDGVDKKVTLFRTENPAASPGWPNFTEFLYKNRGTAAIVVDR